MIQTFIAVVAALAFWQVFTALVFTPLMKRLFPSIYMHAVEDVAKSADVYKRGFIHESELDRGA